MSVPDEQKARFMHDGLTVIVHRGTREVGGTCVEVAAGGTRLVLDAGLPLAAGAGRGPLPAGAAPPVPGLFAADAPPPDAVLLSHAHPDHAGLLPYTRPEIPVYATTGTSKMLLAGGVFAGRASLPRGRFRAVRPGVPVRVGAFAVTALAVDHSAFGAAAFRVEAAGRSVVYTGDLRLHGRKPGMTRELVRAARGADVLLVEGTRLDRGDEPGPTEHEVEDRAAGLVADAPGLVLAAFSPQDVDRLVTVYKAARRAGREFVADVYAAFVLHLAAGEARLPRPTRAAGIRVYYPAAFLRRPVGKLARLFAADRIELAEVLAEPRRFVMAFRPSMTGPDFGGALPPAARVLYGSWAGYLENPDWADTRARLAAAGGDLHPTHASGHAAVGDLVELVRRLDARAVVPVHTAAPERFREFFPNTVQLRDGEPFVVP